ncbi:MAG: caspase family protein [Pseudomonadota bacterium]
MRQLVLIGNSEFPHDPENLPPLSCPGNDVKRLRQLLTDENCGRFDVVEEILDHDHTEIEKRIIRTLKSAAPSDMVMIYYSGHGQKDDEGHAYLCGRDTTTDDIEATGISQTTLFQSIQKSRCRKIALVVDCCFSGRFGDGIEHLGQSRGAQVLFDPIDLDVLDRDSKGIVFLSSSNAAQLSHEDDVKGHGVFTEHMLRGLKDGAADLDRNGKITFDELYQYITESMHNDNVRQTPTLRGSHQRQLHIAVNPRKLTKDEAQGFEDAIKSAFGNGLISQEFCDDVMTEVITFRRRQDADAEKINLLRAYVAQTLDIASMHHQWLSLGAPHAPKLTLAAPVAHAPLRMGGYAKEDVASYVGDYVVVQPYYGDHSRFRGYGMHIRWSEDVPCLEFQESEGRRDHKNAGAVYIPQRSTTLSFVSIHRGQVRQMLVSEHVIRKEMFGVTSTMANTFGLNYAPASVPVLVKRVAEVDPEVIGDLCAETPAHAALLETFQSYARMGLGRA